MDLHNIIAIFPFCIQSFCLTCGARIIFSIEPCKLIRDNLVVYIFFVQMNHIDALKRHKNNENKG